MTTNPKRYFFQCPEAGGFVEVPVGTVTSIQADALAALASLEDDDDDQA